MSLINLTGVDGGLSRAMVPGDIVNGQEIVTDINNAAGVQLTAANLLTGLIGRRGAAGVSDTLPDAASMVNALMSISAYQGSAAFGQVGLQAGASFRVRIVNFNTGTLTIAAGTNFAVVTTWKAATLATLLAGDMLVQCLNGTPAQNFACTTTNASAVVTGMLQSQTNLITPGMAVSGTGIPASTTILSVQPGVGFTMSANATASNVLVAVAFNPRFQAQLIS